MRKLAGSLLATFAVAAVGAQTAPPAKRSIEVFLPPGNLPPADSVQVTLGRAKLPVTSVVAPHSTPGIVIIDLAATPVERHACLVLELAQAMPALGDMPVYQTGGTLGEILYPAGMATGLHLSLMGAVSRLEEQCRKPVAPRTPPTIAEALPALDLIRILTARYRGQGPLRIFWLSGDFEFYDWRKYQARNNNPRMRSQATAPPNQFSTFSGVGEFLAESLSLGPATIFPILGGTQRSVDAGRYLAESTGGRFRLTTNKPGEALRAAVEESKALSLATVELPASGAGPTTLRVQVGRDTHADRLLSLRPPRPDPTPALDEIANRVVTYSDELGLGSGCAEGREGVFVKLILPEGASKPDPGPLLVYIQYFLPDRRSLRQRLVLPRPGPLCIQLNEQAPGSRFIVVAHDEQTGWTGAKNGKLNSSKSK
ncbi:MAG: hypothetical protein NTV70_10255 [Acidobacteria bacterium]|nr:hypothetical protein [Acidobacteriota bacterium]